MGLYELFPANKRVEKKLKELIETRKDILEKLRKLKENPRENVGAHPLHGPLAGRWSCWLGSNLRIIYIINDSERKIEMVAVGTHKIY
ncbi:type II toxin-antitoxin system mRNA interferase toxin, RelE/StbE family [Candidatus Woesearchaeota archaeon]|nr:type II toxin-antitoxin system mRNA interferase toxin, RelE/StbE family [Candidatus Woesearchaeota archaeon]